MPSAKVPVRVNATLAAKVISWRSVTWLSHSSTNTTFFLFSHASAEVRGENTPERKFAPTGYRTHNHQVMSPTRSPLSHPGGANNHEEKCFEITENGPIAKGFSSGQPLQSAQADLN